MRKQEIMTIAALALALGLPEIACASTDFGAAEIAQHATKIQNFLFGPTLKVLGGVAAAGSVIGAMLSGHVKPLLTFGGISLGISVLPSFINSVFSVSSLMLP